MERLIRRFIPKGTDIRKHAKQEIKGIEQCLNTYPQKILNCRTPQKEYIGLLNYGDI